MATYIHERPEWPRFLWDDSAVITPLATARHHQGRLSGIMQALGFEQARTSLLDALTEEIRESSAIEGEYLERTQVRSSVARRLGIEDAASAPPDRRVEGVVEMALDATRRCDAPLTEERLWGWHAALFPTGFSGLRRITAGEWRSGPVRVVSELPRNREKVHYEAPPAERVGDETGAFLGWFEAGDEMDPVLKAALAHLWFVTIHPFDDGNGRIARAIADMALARAERSSLRAYSMSSRIRAEKDDYYDVLERTQKGTLDITEWMLWFLGCLTRALEGAEGKIQTALVKTRFWDSMEGMEVNSRQRKLLNLLVDGLSSKLTTKKWAQIAQSSQDTALRDIQDLVDKGVLSQEGVGRGTHYRLKGEYDVRAGQ